MANRRANLTQYELIRYIKAAATAGLTVGEVRIEPDGTVRIIPADFASMDNFNPWDKLEQ